MSLRLWRRVVAGLAVLLVLGLVGLGLFHWLRTPEVPTYAFIEGQQLVYEFDYLSAAASDFTRLLAEKEASPGLNKTAHTTVQGELALTVLGRQGHTIHLACAVRKPRIDLALDGTLASDLAERLDKDIRKMVFIEADLRGRVLFVRLDPAIDPVASTFIRELLSAIQIVLPKPGAQGLTSWEAKEDDQGGTFLARYELDSQSPGRGLRGVRKSKLHYAAGPRQESMHTFADPVTLEPEGELTAQVDARRGHLVSVKGTTATTFRVGKNTVARTEITLEMQLLTRETLSEQELDALNNRRSERERLAMPVSLTSPEPAEQMEMSVQRTELGKATVDTLLADLALAEKMAPEKVNRTTLYLKFKALVYLHPDTSAQLGRRLASANPGGVTFQVLTQALADSGRPAAQSALVEVMRIRSGDWLALAVLLPALGTARLPTIQAEQALHVYGKATSQAIRTTAQLALGIMARNLAAASPERAEAIVEWALAELSKATSAQQRRQMLLVLGNTGSARALPAIRGFVNDPAPEMRSAAVGALRWLTGEKIDAMLCQALTNDKDDSVRLETAYALEFRTMNATTLTAHRAALKNDRSVSVRLAVLKNLGRTRQDFREIDAWLEETTRDPVKEVREAAAALLED